MSSQAKKRALFLFPTDVMGGAENVTRMLAEATLKSGFFDEVICFVLSGEPHGTLDGLARDQRTRLIYSGAKSEKSSLFRLVRLFAKHPCDLVFSSHTHINAATSAMRRLRVLKTKRLVTRESTMIFERDMGWRGWLIRQLYRFYGKQDLIICQTDRMKQSLIQNTTGRFDHLIETIPNPIDLDAIRSAKAASCTTVQTGLPKTRKIAWCGRLSSVKSPLRAVDALAKLHQHGLTDSHLVMIGDGPMKAEITDHIKSLGMTDNVSLTGRIGSPAVVLQHCEVGLMTSDTEGFPNVILEMLASGVRSVVTTDCAGGLAEIPGVHVAQEKTAQSLATELITQLENRDRDPRIANYLAERDPAKFLQKILA